MLESFELCDLLLHLVVVSNCFHHVEICTVVLKPSPKISFMYSSLLILTPGGTKTREDFFFSEIAAYTITEAGFCVLKTFLVLAGIESKVFAKT